MGFPRRARWKFIFCLEFDMNSLLNNWDNYEVLRMKFWGFIVTIIFIYGSFLTLRCFCLQFWNFAVLNVLHMHYLVLFLICSYVCTCTPALLYPIPFLVYCFPVIAILPTSPHSFKALLSFVLFLLTLLSLTLLVVSPCPKVVVMTLNFTNKPEISSFTIYILCLCCYHSKMKPSTSSYRWSLCPAAMGSSQIHCTSWTSHPPDIANV